MTEDMRFCLGYLETAVYNEPNDKDLLRALHGAQYMSLALDGLSNMLRALPTETQKRMAADMYEIAKQNIGENIH